MVYRLARHPKRRRLDSLPQLHSYHPTHQVYLLNRLSRPSQVYNSLISRPSPPGSASVVRTSAACRRPSWTGLRGSVGSRCRLRLDENLAVFGWEALLQMLVVQPMLEKLVLVVLVLELGLTIHTRLALLHTTTPTLPRCQLPAHVHPPNTSSHLFSRLANQPSWGPRGSRSCLGLRPLPRPRPRLQQYRQCSHQRPQCRLDLCSLRSHA